MKSLAVLTKSIPSEVFEKTSSHTTGDFQLCVADLLGKRASALESLTITKNTDDLRTCMELLTSCSKTLKELDLFGEYKGGNDLELVIPKMPFLRKLNAKFCDGISICSSSLEELCMREPCTILKHSCPGLKKLGVNLKMDYDAQHFDITPALEYLSITLTVGKSGYNHIALQQLSKIIENLPRLKKLRIVPHSCNHKEAEFKDTGGGD